MTASLNAKFVGVLRLISHQQGVVGDRFVAFVAQGRCQHHGAAAVDVDRGWPRGVDPRRSSLQPCRASSEACHCCTSSSAWTSWRKTSRGPPFGVPGVEKKFTSADWVPGADLRRPGKENYVKNIPVDGSKVKHIKYCLKIITIPYLLTIASRSAAGVLSARSSEHGLKALRTLPSSLVQSSSVNWTRRY